MASHLPFFRGWTIHCTAWIDIVGFPDAEPVWFCSCFLATVAQQKLLAGGIATNEYEMTVVIMVDVHLIR